MSQAIPNEISTKTPIHALRLITITALLVVTIIVVAACAGEAGSIGAPGATGPDGPQGEPGPTGSKGGSGEAGSNGAAGLQGERGPKGETGPAGIQGDAGGSAPGIVAGDGLVLVGDVVSADFAGSGNANTVSRSDHSHISDSYTKSEIDTAIASASTASSVWSAITGVPAGFADGIDADALGALSCTSGQVPTFTNGVWACSTPVVAEETSTTASVTTIPIINVVTTIRSNIANGQNMKAAIGIDGLLLIAYYDRSTRRVNTAHCRNRDCTLVDITTHTSSDGAGEFLDLAIGADGRPVISLYDNTTNAVQSQTGALRRHCVYFEFDCHSRFYG